MSTCKAILTENNTPKLALIKSKERVRDAGEVFTPDFLVEEMLDLFPEDAWAKEKNWLEPTCGNGQFILGIIKRKLKKSFGLLEALNTTFGMDIMHDNVKECQARIYHEIIVPYIRASNISVIAAKELICKAVCIIENNIVRTKDSLKDDWNRKFHYFDSLSEHKQQAIITRVRKRLYCK